ncbi:putative multidrug export ATP-binding/permease protein [Enhygromyxa salina]|uniref:Putative multidrug export ATP-binding/permease protein n=1 Tax=Enhygromyxa salina TaxID=215803 RepID=A0A2S9XJV0_9BACT|nr:ABC transporter ATP-binding protein [Enhygromyxa salina]PRP92961.1 putative multidrug export ATP-binding/permease protein [Enhygromyxa salina]
MADPRTTKPLARLLRYARPHRRAIRAATLYSVLNKVFDLAPPVLIGAAVDIVVSREDSFIALLGYAEVGAQLWILAGLTLAAWAIESLFQYAYALKWRRLAQTIEHELRMDLYRHVQGLELAYFEDRSTGGLMAVLNDDVNQLERFLDDGANTAIQLVTTIVVVGGLFLAVVPSVAWMTMLPMPVVIAGSVWIQRRLEPRYAEVRERVGQLNGHLVNNLGGIATIKSFTAEDYEVGQIELRSRAYEAANRSAIRLSSAFVPGIRMVIVIGFAAILVYGGKLALAGELNLGVYSVLVFMTQRLLWPLTGLGTLLDQYQRAMASTTRALDLLDTEAKIVSGEVALAVEDVRGEVSFEDVEFHYGRTSEDAAPVPILRGLSVRIEAGQTVAFVGATGAGKSTLIKLLLRFYDVVAGRVCLDGVDVRELELPSLRRAVGLVSQDVFLFHGTVRDNIAYGSFDASLDEIVEAAKAAEAHEFIMALPEGYDTVVGERGQKLSGGQRQRVSIARAVLGDPPVLILDEATSSVDNETEAAIQRSLERITKGRTTIVIAHRLSTVRSADRTFVLERGRIVEQGTHVELVATGGLYAALWRVQTGEAA